MSAANAVTREMILAAINAPSCDEAKRVEAEEGLHNYATCPACTRLALTAALAASPTAQPDGEPEYAGERALSPEHLRALQFADGLLARARGLLECEEVHAEAQDFELAAKWIRSLALEAHQRAARSLAGERTNV